MTKLQFPKLYQTVVSKFVSVSITKLVSDKVRQ